MIRVKKENHRSWFMSNYYPCEFVMNGIRYKNAEAAFQSHKVPLEERRQFADMPPASAKRFGRNVAIPANWGEARDDVMRRVVMAKFEQNEDLKQRLLETGTQPIEEDTTSWHDNYWGNCHCPKCRNIPGQNRLGTILMETRDALYCSPDTFSIERSVKECLEPIIGKKTKGIPDDQQLEAYKELCRYYYDTRMFGLVNTSYSNCSLLSRIKGACQVSMPMSYDPIEIIPMTITRCCVASDAERKGEDKGAKKGVSIDESDDGAEKKTKDRMIGRRSIIRYGLYHMSIQINSAMAQRNGVTMDDVNLLIDALQHMFEEDMSSSRALTLRKLFVVEHTKPMGNAYRDTIERALAARLKQPNDAPTSYEDYEVTYHREMLPDEVKVTEYNYNSQSV